MCPMRFLLIFFSGMFALYLAWKSFLAPAEEVIVIAERDGKSGSAAAKENGCSLSRASSKAASFFWTLVDMASGRYLWNVINQGKLEKVDAVKAC